MILSTEFAVPIFEPVFVRVASFVLVTAALTAISWRPLHNMRCHGFYRFFVFEWIALLFFLNIPYWCKNRFSMPQLISWVSLLASLAFVFSGLFQLRRFGGGNKRPQQPENLSFENTSRLVTTGIYRYVRHPMYSSLGSLAWGIFLKHMSLAGLFITVLSTGFIFATAKIEEKENIAFFGPSYIAYKKRSKMFIPYVL